MVLDHHCIRIRCGSGCDRSERSEGSKYVLKCSISSKCCFIGRFFAIDVESLFVFSVISYRFPSNFWISVSFLCSKHGQRSKDHLSVFCSGSDGLIALNPSALRPPREFIVWPRKMLMSIVPSQTHPTLTSLGPPGVHCVSRTPTLALSLSLSHSLSVRCASITKAV